MYPAWATDEYANKRTMFVCRSAMRLPTVMVSAASTHSIGSHTSWRPRKPTNSSCMIATNPAAFDATDRNAVIGVGAPSYVSGAQVWNGTAEILNPNPTSTNTMPSVTMCVSAAGDCMKVPMSASTVDPATPKINDMPYSMMAVANTPIR